MTQRTQTNLTLARQLCRIHNQLIGGFLGFIVLEINVFLSWAMTLFTRDAQHVVRRVVAIAAAGIPQSFKR